VIGRPIKWTQSADFVLSKTMSIRDKPKLVIVQPVIEPELTIEDRPGGFSVALVILDADGFNTRVCHATNLTANQVKVVAKLNGKCVNSHIELDGLTTVQAGKLCDWMVKPWFTQKSEESKQALTSLLTQQHCDFVHCLFKRDTHYQEWSMHGKSAVDYLFMFMQYD